MKSTLKNFVDAGYKKKSEATNVNGYILDKDLSTKRDKVYHDPNTGKVVHTIAGTDTLKDWSNNALIPLGLHQYSNRYKNAERIQKKANNKYGKNNVSLVTHSQSGNIAESLANKNLVGGENTTLNPAIIGSHNKNIKVVKSIIDPVSLLTKTNKNDIKIIPKTFNPIKEHSTDILEKTKNIFGHGLLNKTHSKIQSILFKRPEWKLKDCETWLKKHNYKFEVDEKPNHYRFRQFNPKIYEKYITKKLPNNIEFIIGTKKSNKEKNSNKEMKYISDSDSDSGSEASTSEEENERTLKGGALHEQDIIDRLAKLSHDIHVHHSKHGVKKNILKGYSLLGKGLSLVRPIKGGKINRSKKFNSWFKNIGNKFKPLNKNLSPIKHQMTQSAVDNIAYETMTPEQQMQSGINMFNDVVRGPNKSKTPTYPAQESYNTMYEPIIAQPITETAYGGYYNDMPEDFNSMADSYERSYQPKQMSGFGIKGKSLFFPDDDKKEPKMTKQGGIDTANYVNSHKSGFKGIGIGCGVTGKMLKNTAANATANLINAGSTRAVNEMQTRGTKGAGVKKTGRFIKGSQAARDHMARIRAMKK